MGPQALDEHGFDSLGVQTARLELVTQVYHLHLLQLRHIHFSASASDWRQKHAHSLTPTQHRKAGGAKKEQGKIRKKGRTQKVALNV